MFKRTTSLAALSWLLLINSAYATMPVLTDAPNTKSIASCSAWAKKQSEDAIDMWGIQEDGTTSPSAAVRRLTDSCLGKKKPDVVGFGSSAGYSDYYCSKHSKTKLCQSYLQNSRSVPQPSAPKSIKTLIGLDSNEKATTLVFYDSECDSDNYQECVFADISCTDRDPLTVQVIDVDEKKYSKWLKYKDSAATLLIDEHAFTLRKMIASHSDLNGSSDVLLKPAAMEAEAIWQAALSAQRIEIKIQSKTISLPLDTGNVVDLRKTYEFCRKIRSATQRDTPAASTSSPAVNTASMPTVQPLQSPPSVVFLPGKETPSAPSFELGTQPAKAAPPSKQPPFTILRVSKPIITKRRCSMGDCTWSTYLATEITSTSEEAVIVSAQVVGGTSPERKHGKSKVRWNTQPHQIQVRCSYSKPSVSLGSQSDDLPLNPEMGLPGILENSASVYFEVCHSDFDGPHLAAKYHYNVGDNN